MEDMNILEKTKDILKLYRGFLGMEWKILYRIATLVVL